MGTLNHPFDTASAIRLERAASAADRHAQVCGACFIRIIDAEGNPGMFGECCRAGRRLLVAYVDALGESVPDWAREER